MNKVGTKASILSFPTIFLHEGEESKAVARQANEYAAGVRDMDPSRFGFFATLPSLLLVDAVLEEIDYAFDTLQGDGLLFMSRYGNKYLGHPDFKPIWAAANARKAVVFIHPGSAIDDNPVNAFLSPAVLDFPQETTKTAFDMIISGTLRSYLDINVILSHAGGSVPYVVGRAASLLPSFAGLKTASTEDILEEAKRFYFDLALSSTSHTLDTLLRNFPNDHVMYGSDFPFAPPVATIPLSKALDTYEVDEETRVKVYQRNAFELFPRLREWIMP
jgi:predicted TIM-barrel fold metal-dependent hydrolase